MQKSWGTIPRTTQAATAGRKEEHTAAKKKEDDSAPNYVNGVLAPSKAYLRKQAAKLEVKSMLTNVSKADPLKLFHQATIQKKI